MDLIIDANILFAILIKDSVNAELIVDENIHLFAPEYLFQEFYKHKEEILEKMYGTEREFNDIYDILKSIITIIPAEEFEGFLKEAEHILVDHPKDAPYFALAIKLKCPIWSNEKRLKNQKVITVYSTRDILSFIRPE